MSELTAKQEQFCREYLIDLNATQAAIRAGYSVDTAKQIGYDNFTKPYIAERIAELKAEREKRTEITADNVLREIAKVGFSNLLDYMTVQADGYAYVDMSNMTRDQAAALAEISVDEYTDGSGEDARPIKRVKIKTHNKITALENLAKHLNICADTLKVSGEIEVTTDPLKASRMIAAMMAGVVANQQKEDK